MLDILFEMNLQTFNEYRDNPRERKFMSLNFGKITENVFRACLSKK